MSMETSTESAEPGLPPAYLNPAVSSPHNTQTSLIGRRRSAESLKKPEYAFLLVSFLSVFTSLGFTIYRLVTSPKESEDTIFAVVLLINIVFCLIYIVDGIFREQYYEIVAVVLTTVIMLIYITLNFVSGENHHDLLKLIRLCLSAVLGPPVVILGILLAIHYSEKGFLIFRTVGGRLDLQNACKLLRLADTLILFDAQAMASLLVLVLGGGTSNLKNEEIWTLSIGGSLTALWLLLGSMAMRFESRRATFLFLVLGFGQPAFVIWRFYETPFQFSQVSVLYKCAFAAGVITLIVGIALFVVTLFVQKNYGKGLRQRVYEPLP